VRIGSGGEVELNLGSAGSPSLFFNGDANTGLYSPGANQLAISTNGSERLRIDSSGRLLVGTSSARLHASGTTPTLQVEGSSGALSIRRNIAVASALPANFFIGRARGGAFEAVTSGDYLGKISFTGADGSAQIAAATIEAIVDGTPGANDMPGRLVFSTTADGASSPTGRMQIKQDGRTMISREGDFGAGSDGESLFVIGDAGFACSFRRNTSTGGIVGFKYGPAIVGSISTNGTNTTYNTSSDYRLKENVVPLTGAVDRVNQLQVNRFNFIADPDKTVDGFIAHEAQAVVPECVTGTKDEIDDEGNPVYQGIDQSKLVPLLTAALQEAIAKIKTLEQRLSDAGIA